MQGVLELVCMEWCGVNEPIDPDIINGGRQRSFLQIEERMGAVRLSDVGLRNTVRFDIGRFPHSFFVSKCRWSCNVMRNPDPKATRQHLTSLRRTCGRLVFMDAGFNRFDMFPRINHERSHSQDFRAYVIPLRLQDRQSRVFRQRGLGIEKFSKLFSKGKTPKKRSHAGTERICALTDAEAVANCARHIFMENNRVAARMMEQNDMLGAPPIPPVVIPVSYNPAIVDAATEGIRSEVDSES